MTTTTNTTPTSNIPGIPSIASTGTGTSTEERRAAARVPLTEPTSLFGRLMTWYSRRTYGDVLDPGLAMLHNRRVLMSVLRLERRVEKWDRLDPDLKTLAEMTAASVIGCSWCMDFGYWAAHSKGQRVDKLREVPRWRESEAFTPLERLVLEYAGAMTVTPPEVTDELAADLRRQLGDAAFVELTAIVGLENERSRVNSALGLHSQGLSDRCELPARSTEPSAG
jgi:alkylhydroperoxidase family enzyme